MYCDIIAWYCSVLLSELVFAFSWCRNNNTKVMVWVFWKITWFCEYKETRFPDPQLTSEVRPWLICSLAQGQTWFWALMRQILRALLFLHHPRPLLSLLSVPCRVTGQDRAGAAEVILWSFWIPCYWYVQGSCCSSHPSWEPCLKILGGSLVSRRLNSVAVSTTVDVVISEVSWTDLKA